MSEIKQASPYLGWALWISEIWYSWAAVATKKRDRLYAKTRGIVLYDRVLNCESGTTLARYLEAA